MCDTTVHTFHLHAKDPMFLLFSWSRSLFMSKDLLNIEEEIEKKPIPLTYPAYCLLHWAANLGHATEDLHNRGVLATSRDQGNNKDSIV